MHVLGNVGGMVHDAEMENIVFENLRKESRRFDSFNSSVLSA
jgi:hypothetical protein